MSKRTKTTQDIPSVTNSGLKVAPYSNTSRFMELHKLDYKRSNLLNKIKKSERDMKNMKRNLSIIESDIAKLMSKVEIKSEEVAAIDPEANDSHKAQLLKY